MQTAVQERRVSIRTNMLGVTAKISKDGWKWEEVFVEDISDGGMGFVATEELQKEEMLILEGEASDFTRGIDISCDIKVVFVGTTPDGKYRYGIRFEKMSKAQRTGLSILIELTATKFPELLLQ
jgi:c-di-GMP-binding flagellar brake protein YcgR